jgi:adenylate cyclase
MARISNRVVLCADLRGSTGLFEVLGNEQATILVTRCVASLGHEVAGSGGQVFKTLGDGLMATFDRASEACLCAERLHRTLASVVVDRQTVRAGAQAELPLRLQVALALGEVVEKDGDCFGDAVNLAARLVEHTGDDETLVTESVFEALPAARQPGFRRLDRIAVRGRSEPVAIWVALRRGGTDEPDTHFGELPEVPVPTGLTLAWVNRQERFEHRSMPLVIGRDPNSACCIDLPRVSRSHARVDWHAGSFQLTDLSFNGTYLRFHDGERLVLRRSTCPLVGRGLIGLGSAPDEPGAAVMRFDASTTP